MINHSRAELVHFSKQKIAEITSLTVDQIDENTEFMALGLDSVKALFLLQELEEFIDEEINPLIFWNYPSIGTLADYLISKEK